MTHCIKLVAGA